MEEVKSHEHTLTEEYPMTTENMTYTEQADSLRLRAILSPEMSHTELAELMTEQFPTTNTALVGYIAEEAAMGKDSFDLEDLAVAADLFALGEDGMP